MIKASTFCRVRIVTDCTTTGVDDINEETLVKILDLKKTYYDLKDRSRVVIENTILTAVVEKKLFSIFILEPNVVWNDIIT